jgi:hypothetical protein
MPVYNDQMVFNHILRSNIPREEKSTIRKWFDSLTGGKATEVIERYGLDKPAETKITVGEVLVAGSEAMGVGGALGAMHALLKDGLDQKIPFTNKRVAVDGALGGVGYLGALFSPIGKEHLKNVGTSATAVYGFRKFHDMLAAKRSISKIEGEESAPTTSEKLDDEEPAPSDIGEDPIVTLSKSLDD